MNTTALYDILYACGPRLPRLEQWMRDDVWSAQRYMDLTPQEYLHGGEKMIKEAEEVILHAAGGLYDELCAASLSSPSLVNELQQDKTAVVIFDGLSIRELPLLVSLAEKSGHCVEATSYGYAALPSDTRSFIEQRLLGKCIGPSQLESRKELKEQNITVRYYDTMIRRHELHHSSGSSMLLWSAFPDGTYKDFEARSSGHFETIVKQFDVAWKNIVLAVPRGYRIIVTSDHGYVFLHTGYESAQKAEGVAEMLGNDRFRIFDNENELPQASLGLQVVAQKRLAMLKGRIKNRPQGPSANKVFRHGGMSLMEMLTPYLELRSSL